jgi:hypothetical protein
MFSTVGMGSVGGVVWRLFIYFVEDARKRVLRGANWGSGVDLHVRHLEEAKDFMLWEVMMAVKITTTIVLNVF